MKTKQDFPTINERPPEGTKEDGSKFRVLVVDDSIFVAKQLGQILSSEGYEITKYPQIKIEFNFGVLKRQNQLKLQGYFYIISLLLTYILLSQLIC